MPPPILASLLSLLSLACLASLSTVYSTMDPGLQSVSRMGCYLLYAGAYFYWYDLACRRVHRRNLWKWRLNLVFHPVVSVLYMAAILRRVK